MCTDIFVVEKNNYLVTIFYKCDLKIVTTTWKIIVIIKSTQKSKNPLFGLKCCFDALKK